MSRQVPWLIVGLGNPGDKYANTLHNVGRDTVEILAESAGATIKSHKSGLMIGHTHLSVAPGGAFDDPVYLAFPRTFMNLSGGPVAAFARLERIPTQRILVMHDDLDLLPHSLRLKEGGGEGGHNGLKSISSSLGTRDYVRLRIGIGRPPGRMDAASYVLHKVPKAQREEWKVTCTLAANTARDLVVNGLVETQRELHRSQKLAEAGSA